MEKREKELELKEKQSKSVILVNYYTITLFNYMHCNLQECRQWRRRQWRWRQWRRRDTRYKSVPDCDAYTFIVNSSYSLITHTRTHNYANTHTKSNSFGKVECINILYSTGTPVSENRSNCFLITVSHYNALFFSLCRQVQKLTSN